jgi:hypothetical protein
MMNVVFLRVSKLEVWKCFCFDLLLFMIGWRGSA